MHNDLTPPIFLFPPNHPHRKSVRTRGFWTTPLFHIWIFFPRSLARRLSFSLLGTLAPATLPAIPLQDYLILVQTSSLFRTCFVSPPSPPTSHISTGQIDIPVLCFVYHPGVFLWAGILPSFPQFGQFPQGDFFTFALLSYFFPKMPQS